jgi:zinc protease
LTQKQIALPRTSFGLLFALLFSCASLHAQDSAPILPKDLSQPIPFDSTVLTGKLPNGLTYYVRKNAKPEHRAELRLAVNVGSMQEDDDQRGLAHLIEHMAFDGTAHFEKAQLINYLESIGMRFGPDINASTSFDETVFQLDIPTDSSAILSNGLLILEDWAHSVSLDDDKIDKEKGVVLEEWRLGRGADARMRDKEYPFLFKDSRYAERVPIGTYESLTHFTHAALKRFYHDWYRPELMAVIAVGDFDPAKIRDSIVSHFGKIPTSASPRKREVYYVPGHADPYFVVATDSEAGGSSVGVYYEHPTEPESRHEDYRRQLVEGMFTGMLNDRFDELARKPDPPFINGGGSEGELVRTRSTFVVEASTKDSGITTGLGTLLRESKRAEVHGFTQSELDRQKDNYMRSIESAYAERDKTESENYAEEYVRVFLNGEPSPGIAYEYAMYKSYIPSITLEEVNKVAARFITDSNRVVTVDGPKKASAGIPSIDQIKAVFASADTAGTNAYVDSVGSGPLVDPMPTPGSITQEGERKEISVTELRLSNGARIILKPTDFKNDEIVMSAFSEGGTSLLADSDIIPAATATAIVDQGGLGNFNLLTLQKKLAGTIAGATPHISELEQGFSGSSSVKDLETMFQLVYLYFTAPRKDSSAFLSYKQRLYGILQNRNDRPEAAYSDTISVTMSQHNPRSRPWSMAMLNELNLDKSYRIYRDRFADAGEFTFLFVGSFTMDQIKPLLAKYIAPLPSAHRNEHWRDLGISPPKGVIEKEVDRGVEPKSEISLIFTGPFAWSPEHRYAMSSMGDVLSIKLREALREDKGGTYDVSVNPGTAEYPQSRYTLSISFGCDPARLAELTQLAFAVIDSVKRFGVDSLTLAKVKEQQRREREVGLKENGFWLSYLEYYYDHGEDPGQILKLEDRMKLLNSQFIQDAANQYIDMKNYVKVVLLPETKSK